MARAKANKQIAHLTYHRTGVTEQEKTWDVEPIPSDVTSALRTFTVLVPQSRVQGDFRDRVDAALPPSAPALPAHGPRFATTSTISPDQLKGPAPRS
jgi:hypothetical protein